MSSSITLVDQADLRNFCKSYPKLEEELYVLLEANFIEAQARVSNFHDLTQRSKPLSEIISQKPDTRGADLCQKLKDLKPGKKFWAQYENVCDEILRYLFPQNLKGWHKQKRTDDGLNRYDYVCRVTNATGFWEFVIDHLNSRYVLFEFKNYSSKIKQGQILTTEKYLLERGLRRLAIIMTRVGADKNAVIMTQGAMREQGKLMLILDDVQVCKMLQMKERGEDPTDCLFDLADDFLLKLPR